MITNKMDKEIIREVLNDHFEYYIKYNDISPGKSNRDNLKKNINRKAKKQLFELVPVIKLKHAMEELPLIYLKKFRRNLKECNNVSAISIDENEIVVNQEDEGDVQNIVDQNLCASNNATTNDNKIIEENNVENEELFVVSSVNQINSPKIQDDNVSVAANVNTIAPNETETRQTDLICNENNNSEFSSSPLKRTRNRCAPLYDENISHIEFIDNVGKKNEVLHNKSKKSKKPLTQCTSKVSTLKTSKSMICTLGNDSSNNIVAIKHNNKKKSGGSIISIKLPHSLKHMSSFTPLNIEIDLSKMNFSTCTETANNIYENSTESFQTESISEENHETRMIKRKTNKNNEQVQHKKPKIIGSIEEDNCNSDNLREYYETFNEMVEETVSDNNNVVSTTSVDQNDNQNIFQIENPCQYSRVDTTSNIGTHDQIVQVGATTTDKNDQQVVTKPVNKIKIVTDVVTLNDQEFFQIDAMSPREDNRIVITVPGQQDFSPYIINSQEKHPCAETTSAYSIVSETNKNIELHNKGPAKKYITVKEYDIRNKNLSSNDSNTELGSTSRSMPLLDEILDESETKNETSKTSEMDKNKIEKDNDICKETDNLIFVDNRNEICQPSPRTPDKTIDNPITIEGVISELKESGNKTSQNNELGSIVSYQEKDILHNPHKIIDDFLNSVNEQLDFETEDDTLDLYCSPNIFDDIDIPEVKLPETTSSTFGTLRKFEMQSISTKKNDFDKLEKKLPKASTNISLIECEIPSTSTKQNDDLFIEDYTDYDIFGIPRQKDYKRQLEQKNTATNTIKNFKIPKFQNVVSSTVTSTSQMFQQNTNNSNVPIDPRPVRPCWPNNPTNIARPPINYRVGGSSGISSTDPNCYINQSCNNNTNNNIDQFNIIQVFDKPCLDNLQNICRKGVTCQYRHNLLDSNEVKERLSICGDQHIILSYQFTKRYHKLHDYYFLIFCTIFTSKKRFDMLLQMVIDCTAYSQSQCLYYLRNLIKFLITFGKSKNEVVQIILQTMDGIPNLDEIKIDLISDHDIVLYNLNILRFYIQSSYKFHTITANKLSSCYLRSPNEELCKIIFDILLNTADFPKELALDKSQDLITFLKQCQSNDGGSGSKVGPPLFAAATAFQ